jgi:hypothetical protein
MQLPKMLSPTPQPFPQSMTAAVMDYKKMAADYATVSDPTVKASYKVVLDKKIGDLRASLTAYTTTASAAIDALVVQ